jgi:hypothetical protein
MKNWFKKHYKTLIITTFLIPIVIVAVVSISHVTLWYGITNPLTWALYLSVGIEVAALSALAALSANMGSKVYFPFTIVTIIQFIGNVFFAYSFIDVNAKIFKDWVELMSPFVEFMGVESTDLIGHKRFLSFFSGGLLPMISLSFLHMLVKFIEVDKNREDGSLKEEEIKVDTNDILSDATRLRLSENDLKILEEALLNPPPPPNEKLVEAAKKYNETQKEDLVEMMENDQKLGLYDEPFENPLVNESESHLEPQEIEEPITNERTQQQKLEDDVKSPQNTQEMLLTTNDEIITSIPSDDEISDWDLTLMDGLDENYIDSVDEPIDFEVEAPETIEDTYNISKSINEGVITPSLSDEEINEMFMDEWERKFDMVEEDGDTIVSEEPTVVEAQTQPEIQKFNIDEAYAKNEEESINIDDSQKNSFWRDHLKNVEDDLKKK